MINIGNATIGSYARYLNCGIDNVISATDIEDTLPGDILTVTLYYSSTVYYTHTETLSASISSYAHTIPASVFNNLTTARDYTISIGIKRNNPSYNEEKTFAYRLVSRPTIMYNGMRSASKIDLPMSSPTQYSIGWRVSGVDSIGAAIQGNATIVKDISTSVVENTAEVNTIMDTDAYDFNSVFSNVSNLTGAMYTVYLNVNVVHSIYGSFSITASATRILTVANPDIPGISQVRLSNPIRYVGAPTVVTVNTSLYGIQNGDKMLFELKNGSVVLFSYLSGNLATGSTGSSCLIPSDSFADLLAGSYTVSVTSIRDNIRKETKSAIYEAIKPPTLHFVGINPNNINLPIIPSVDITSSWYIDGKDVTSIQGDFELLDTSHKVTLNKTF